jgi:hypothetical protein
MNKIYKKTSLLLITLVGLLINVSCDSDIKKAAKKMNEERFSSYLENSANQINHSADSVRNLVAEYAKKLPKDFSHEITLVNIDTVSVQRDVWCKMYFSSNAKIDSIAFTNKVDSIVTHIEPFKSWLKYGEYSKNVEFWCYRVNKNDTTRISTIPPKNY